MVEKVLLLKIVGGIAGVGVVGTTGYLIINEQFKGENKVVEEKKKEGDGKQQVENKTEEINGVEQARCVYFIDNLAKEIKRIFFNSYLEAGWEMPKNSKGTISTADIDALKDKIIQLKN